VAKSPPPRTPDGRYIVVRGRLWRTANPHLPEERRVELVAALMQARRRVKDALADNAGDDLAAARQAVDATKRGLGERGQPWWSDGSPDFNRHMALNTPYRDWWLAQAGADEN
jgi:hypothetical protein